jgi:hypothetical protein
MKLQSIQRELANDIWNERNKDENYQPAININIEEIGDYDQTLSDLELEELVDGLRDIQSRFEGRNNKATGGLIDSEVCVLVHQQISRIAYPRELSNIGFWRWLSNIASEGYFWKFIKWRFPEKPKKPLNPVNWGIASSGSIIEVYFYRAWLRGYKMYDSSRSDPYHYAKIGGSDIWRSHILRQDFGRDIEFIKAFLDTLHDKNGKQIVGTENLRTILIPGVRSWTSSGSFSHLNYEESMSLIKRIHEEGI